MSDYSFVVTQPFGSHAVGDVLTSVDPEQARFVTRVAAVEAAAPVAPVENPAVEAAKEAVVAAEAAEHAAEVAQESH
jgi:hypothetical protein